MQRDPMLTTRMKGFSLIEFMVAMVLGIIIIGGAVSVYLASKRSYTEVEQVAALSENGRFAMQMLNDSLRHAGFFGAANPLDVREDGSLTAVVGDCSGNAEAFRFDEYLLAESADGSGAAFGCVTDAVPGTDVLVIKQALPRPLLDSDPDNGSDVPDGVFSFPSGLSNQEVYVVANSEVGLLLDGADTAPNVLPGNEFALASAWPYRVYVYYVRQGNTPTLSRRVLTWNGSAMAMNQPPEDLVEGVENMRILFGLVDMVSLELEGWVNLTGLPGNIDRVEALEVFLLLRSSTNDPQHTDEKSYRLGDITVTPSTDANYDENARRLLVHSTISLRNPKLAIRGGA